MPFIFLVQFYLKKYLNFLSGGSRLGTINFGFGQSQSKQPFAQQPISLVEGCQVVLTTDVFEQYYSFAEKTHSRGKLQHEERHNRNETVRYVLTICHYNFINASYYALDVTTSPLDYVSLPIIDFSSYINNYLTFCFLLLFFF